MNSTKNCPRRALLSAGSPELVATALQIRSRRSGLFDALEDLGQAHCVVTEPRYGIRQVRIAVPAVFEAVAIADFAAVGRIPVYHFVLTYSNRETGTICYSESLESLSEG